MTDAIAILVPVLGRPHRLAPLVESIEAATPEPHSTWIICSPDDEATAAELDRHRQVIDPPTRVSPDGNFRQTPTSHVEHFGGRNVVFCTVSWSGETQGDYARKINAAFAGSDEPWIFQAADDLRFHPGWLTEALEVAEGFGVVGTNDLYNPRVLAGYHSTHSLIRRSYVEAEGLADGTLGQVLSEAYHHAYCDDELVRTAQARGQFVHAARSIVEHLHPYAGKSELDATYRKGMASIAHDHDVYLSREHLWNPDVGRPRPPRVRRAPLRH